MVDGFGTAAWLRRTGGVMTATDRLRELSRGIATRLGGLPAQLRRRATSAIDPDTIRAPDTAAARAAEALCRDASPEFLVNHCMRAYLWARVFAVHDRIEFDDELLFVACTLHDLGMTERFGHPGDGSCFTVQSIRGAMDLATEHIWTDERRAMLADAIGLHLNLAVGLRQGAHAHLLHEGVALDVVGARLRSVGATEIDGVLARYPRRAFKTEFVPRYREAALASPRCRGAFHMQWLGFGRLVGSAPYDE